MKRDARRWAPAVALISAAGLTVAGCTGASTPQVASAPTIGADRTSASASALSTKPRTLADERKAYIAGQQQWVNCLRQHGLNATDPDSKGNVEFPDVNGQNKTDPKIVAAQKACSSLDKPVPPAVAEADKPLLTPQQYADAKQYAKCMQANGAPEFPDPTPKGFPDTIPNQVQWQLLPRVMHALAICDTAGDPNSTPAG